VGDAERTRAMVSSTRSPVGSMGARGRDVVVADADLAPHGVGSSRMDRTPDRGLSVSTPARMRES
jgi:hypothetical protein